MCNNAVDNDSDAKVNDGCPPRNTTAESGAQCDNALDDDSDGKVNDGCPQVGTRPEASYVEVCDGLDNDADTVVDEGYPDTNPGGPKDCQDSLVDTDGDTVVNTSDTNDDYDGDGDPAFNDRQSDAAEAWAGTDSLDACPEDSNDDAWPPDFNNNTIVNAIETATYKGMLGTAYGYPGSEGRQYQRRLDLNGDGAVNALDPLLLRIHMGTMCN